MHFYPVPGGVISVADSDGLLGETSFGFADLERSVPMSVQYRFEIGSISKFFTGLVINQLITEGRLGLDETVAEVLPWLKLANHASSSSVRQLLTHTAGFALGSDALPDDAAEIVNARDFDASPGEERFHYSNVGYLLLGEIVRARTGVALGELVRDNWLAPLAMNGALAQVTHDDRPSLAPGYWSQHPDRPWVPGDPLVRAPWFELDSATGNVVATSADMVRLMAALLAAGGDDASDDARPVITRAIFEQMTNVLAPGGEPTYLLSGMAPVESSRYGMGINVERIGGHLCVSHGGGMVGYSTFMLIDCTLGVGVTVLTNANGNSIASHLLARATLASMTSRLEGSIPARWSLDTTVRALTHEAALGTFTDDRGVSLGIIRSDLTSTIRVRVRGAEGTLYELHNGRFVTDLPELRRFHLDWRQTDEGGEWLWGPSIFRRNGGACAGLALTPHPLVGHYRTYSPWYPEFRIYERDNTLYLAAGDGIEAPGEELLLTEVAPGIMRIGDDPWMPERLVLGVERDGEVVGLNRDGCWYSRVFSP